MKENEIAVALNNISKTFYVKENNSETIRDNVFSIFSRKKTREIKALMPISVNIYKGEIFGIIGRNGSGKSTLLKIIMGSILADKGGSLNVNGRKMRLALGMGFDPGLTARENVFVNSSVLGISNNETKRNYKQIFEFAELVEFQETKVKHYSSGMRSRLAFAVAMHAQADVFLFDEFFGGVGDLSFKQKSQKAFKEYLLMGKTIVLVSHSLSVISSNCSRVMYLDKGELVAIGKTNEIIEMYKNATEKK